MNGRRRFVAWCLILFVAVAGVTVTCRQWTVAAPVLSWVPWNDGLSGSRVTALARSADGTLYAGTADEGVFSSMDGGVSWKWAGQGLPQVSGWPMRTYPEVSSLTADQQTGYLWAGTTRGLYVRAGGDWRSVAVSAAGGSIVAFAVLPPDSRLAFAASGGAVFRSSDGGSTWAAVGAPLQGVQARTFVRDRYDSHAVICCTAQGVFRSSDDGRTWLPMGGQPVDFSQFAQSAHDRSTVLGGGPAGVFRSYDGGISWSRVTPDGVTVLGLVWDDYDVTQVRVLAREGILRSDDRGETWSWEARVTATSPLLCGLMSSSTAGSQVLAGVAAGVLSIRNGLADLYQEGLGFLDSTAVGIDSRQNQVYALRRRTLYAARGEAARWSPVDLTFGNVRVLSFAVDQTQPRVLYAVTESGLFRSSDGGQGWTSVKAPPGRARTVCADSSTVDVLYVGTSSGLFRSQYGSTRGWESVSPVPGSAVDAVAVNPVDSTRVYAVAGDGVWKSTDRCDTWLRSGSVAGLGLQMLTMDQKGTALLAATLEGPMVSDDDGQTWSAWGSGLAGRPASYVAAGTGSVAGLVATEDGVFRLASTQDNMPPILAILSPQDSMVTSSPTIDVIGSATDRESSVVSVTVNGTSVALGADGSFNTRIELTRGDNTITVVATDAAGNSARRQLRVTWKQTPVVLTLQLGSRTMLVVGKPSVLLDAEPVVFHSRTFLPIRAVVESLGGTVGWNGETRSAELRLGDQTVILTIGQPVALVNGRRVPVDAQDGQVVPMIAQGRTLLPVRFVAESLGCRVDWNQTDKTIVITYPDS